MAIKFQYNKTSLTEIGKQLKVRQRALPTLQSKESALRLEVRKAKEESIRQREEGGGLLVYDLYTGTGTIANFVAGQARKVIGIEYVSEAIEDAKVNSRINGIENTEFFAGDMKDILNKDFIEKHGKPDIIITDPPRAGMHGDVIDAILFANPQRIVYVSCNPATQARDLQLLSASYEVKRIQPVDMVPHTQHVENVVLLERKV